MLYLFLLNYHRKTLAHVSRLACKNASDWEAVRYFVQATSSEQLLQIKISTEMFTNIPIIFQSSRWLKFTVVWEIFEIIRSKHSVILSRLSLITTFLISLSKEWAWVVMGSRRDFTQRNFNFFVWPIYRFYFLDWRKLMQFCMNEFSPHRRAENKN